MDDQSEVPDIQGSGSFDQQQYFENEQDTELTQEQMNQLQNQEGSNENNNNLQNNDTQENQQENNDENDTKQIIYDQNDNEKNNVRATHVFSSNTDISEKISFWENKCKKDKSEQVIIEVPDIFDPFGPIKNNKDIVIEVLNSVQKTSGISKYTAYLIVTKEEGSECQIYRRFSEFECLRQALVDQFPGIYIPSIPDKQSINVSDYQNIKYRTRVFNGFLKQIATIPYLMKSKPVQIFLKSPDSDCRKQLEQIKPNVIQTIEKLGEQFSYLQGKELNQEHISEVNKVAKNINQSTPKLKELINYMSIMADTKDKHDQNLSSLFEFCLFDYEKINFSEYIGKDDRKLLMANKELKEFTELKNDIMKQGAYNPYRQILECMQSELLIEEAMLDAINQRNNLEKKKNQVSADLKKTQEDLTKLEQGKKSSLSSMFSKKSPEEKIEKIKAQIEKLQMEHDNLEKLYDIQTAIFAFVEIDIFKKRKENIYKKMTKLVSSSEVNKSTQSIQFWQQFGDLAKEFSTIKNDEEDEDND